MAEIKKDVLKSSPGSLQEAAGIVRSELLHHSAWYDALVSSIAGYLKEVSDGTGLYDIAEGLAKRLIGDN